eukprot:25671-Ditylum_brightwellii.AAC.1
MAHFYIEQGYLSIKHFLGHLQEESLTGQHFMVLLSQAQLISGSARPYLNKVNSNKEYVPTLWLGRIWKYLCYTNASLEVHHAWVPTLQQENDVLLMDMFETTKLGTATLDHLCQVWLYLGTTTLADLCDDDGRLILCGMLTGSIQCRPVTPWPNQENPSKLSWQIWRRYLRRLFLTKIPTNSRLDKDWPLYHDLGLWTTSTPSIMRDAYIKKSTDILYVRSDNGYFVHHVRSTGHMSTYVPMESHDTKSPDTAIFIPIHRLNGKVV